MKTLSAVFSTFFIANLISGCFRSSLQIYAYDASEETWTLFGLQKCTLPLSLTDGVCSPGTWADVGGIQMEEP
jgi:hypothetical protein